MEIMSPKKKKTKMTTTTTLYVPNDIIIDILSWVPANSLLRLRWACKYWFYLITRDDDFIIKQFHRSTSSTTNKPSLLISKPFNPHLHYYPCTKIFQCNIDYYYSTTTTGTGSSFSCGAMNPILSGIFVYFEILGSCHGLILFSYYFQEGYETRILCIWNPCTKEYKYLPKPLYWFDGNEDMVFGVYTNFGLGYDHSIQDYKVICNVKSQDGSIVHIQVYTLRTNSWKHIESFPTNWDTMFGGGFFGNGVFANGALYFICYNDYVGGARRILSIDFEKEMYVEISNQPECLNDMANYVQGLAMFEGSLCLTMINSTWIEAWVMKKKDYYMNNNNNNNNNQEEYSWSKLYEIPYIYNLLYDKLQPQRLTKDGEILLLARPKPGMEAHDLVLFDPKNNKLTIHEVYNFHPIEQAVTRVDIHKIEVTYIESLVSLNSGTYIDEKGDYMHYWRKLL